MQNEAVRITVLVVLPMCDRDLELSDVTPRLTLIEES